MLLYPSVDLLRKKVDSKYTLAVMSAKRARDLIDGKPTLVPADDTIKPISIATEEISEDLISYKRVEETTPAATAEEADEAEAEAEGETEAAEEESEEQTEEQ